MSSAEQFIKRCKKIIADYGAGKLTLNDAAAKINPSPFGYPFDGPAHPMIYKVADLAFDIGEDYRSEKEDAANWVNLVRTLDNYLTGKWEPTCWILSASYSKPAHSYSVSVRRQNGKTTIETAFSEAKETIGKVIRKLNKEQTDRYYLQNLALIMPNVVGGYKLAGLEVEEYLTEPYYSA